MYIMSKTKRLSFILKQLDNLSKDDGKLRGKNFWLKCPFHKDLSGNKEKMASLSINLSKPDIGFGTFHCFSCKASGGWNKLAKKLHLKTLGKHNDYDEYCNIDIYKEDLIKWGLEEEDEINYDNINLLPYDGRKWRKINGELLTDLGAKIIYNDVFKDLQLYLPVNVNKKEVGHISCLFEKIKDVSSYFNSPGEWAEDALFPYDFIRKNMNTKILSIVEGPRDALNLIQYGMPALAMLGSYSFNEYCRDLILNLNPELIILALDPDRAGKKATKLVYKYLYEYVNIVKKKFEEETDPADLNRVEVNKMIKLSQRKLQKIEGKI